MEYGHEITSTGGAKTFFVEGCTYCRMSTAGVHEPDCPCAKNVQGLTLRRHSYERDELVCTGSTRTD